MLQNSQPAVRVAAAIIVVAAVAAAVFAGVSLAGGGEDDPSPAAFQTVPPSPPLDLTPPPPSSPWPTHDPSLPTQPADDTNRTPDPNATPDTPESVTISSVEIPIPDGWNYSCCGWPGGPSPLHWIWAGDTNVRETGSGPVYLGVWFDEFGLRYANIAPGEEEPVTPTLDALWTLTQKVATPVPASVQLQGQTIPMPTGAFYTTEEGAPDVNPTTYIVRTKHSVFMFDNNGVFNVSVRPEDSAKVQATFTALNSLSSLE